MAKFKTGDLVRPVRGSAHSEYFTPGVGYEVEGDAGGLFVNDNNGRGWNVTGGYNYFEHYPTPASPSVDPALEYLKARSRELLSKTGLVPDTQLGRQIEISKALYELYGLETVVRTETVVDFQPAPKGSN